LGYQRLRRAAMPAIPHESEPETMLFDPWYWLVIGGGLVLSLLASSSVKSTFTKFSRVRSRSGRTGAEVARAILQAHDIHDVKVEPVGGTLTDHYDPRSKTLRLSEPVFHQTSVAALGVAAHEVGHAIQHAQGYAPLQFRSLWVPIAGFGSNLGIWVIIAAAMMGGVSGAPLLTWIGLGLFATATVFTLVTLPVEFDASKRALQTLSTSGVLASDEMPGAKKVLDAAAMTYVAAAAASLMMLLYWAARLGLFGGRDE
jgi:Zn-dependent membrane protease YugP